LLYYKISLLSLPNKKKKERPDKPVL